MSEALALFDTAPDLRTDGGRVRCPACGTLTAAPNLAPATTYDGPRVCRRCADIGAEAATLDLDAAAPDDDAQLEQPRRDWHACDSCGKDPMRGTKRHPGGGASYDGTRPEGSRYRCHDCVDAEDHPDPGPMFGAGLCEYGRKAGDSPGRYCPEPGTYTARSHEDADQDRPGHDATIHACRAHADYYARAWAPDTGSYPYMTGCAWIELPADYYGPKRPGPPAPELRALAGRPPRTVETVPDAGRLF